MTAIRVLIADDHASVRSGLRFMLSKVDDIVVVGEAKDGVEALRLAQELQPDVLLLDMEMPRMSGMQVSRQLQEAKSPVQVLALSAYDDRQYILSMLESGVAGYLVKREAPETIVKAIRSVGEGEVGWFSHQVAAKLDEPSAAGRNGQRLVLNQQERRILQLLVEHKSQAEIAAALRLEQNVLAETMAALFRKIGATSRAEAMAFALREGLDRP